MFLFRHVTESKWNVKPILKPKCFLVNRAPDSLPYGVDEELSLGGFKDGHAEEPEHPSPARDQQLRDSHDDVSRLPTKNTVKIRQNDFHSIRYCDSSSWVIAGPTIFNTGN